MRPLGDWALDPPLSGRAPLLGSAGADAVLREGDIVWNKSPRERAFG